MSCIMRFQTGDRSWALPLMHQRCALLNSGVRRASKATPMLDQRSNVPLSTAIFLSLKFSVALVMNHQQWSFYPLVLLSPGRTQRTSPTTSDSAVSPSSCTDGTGPRIGVGMSCSGATRYSGMNLANVWDTHLISRSSTWSRLSMMKLGAPDYRFDNRRRWRS